MKNSKNTKNAKSMSATNNDQTRAQKVGFIVIDNTFGLAYRGLNLSAELTKMLASALKCKVDGSKSIEEYAVEYGKTGLRDVLRLKLIVLHKHNKSVINDVYTDKVRRLKSKSQRGSDEYIVNLEKAKREKDISMTAEIKAYRELLSKIKEGFFDLERVETFGDNKLEPVAVVSRKEVRRIRKERKAVESENKKSEKRELVENEFKTKVRDSIKTISDKVKDIVKSDSSSEPESAPTPVDKTEELPSIEPRVAFAVVPEGTPAEDYPQIIKEAISTVQESTIQEPKETEEPNEVPEQSTPEQEIPKPEKKFEGVIKRGRNKRRK